MYGYVFKGNVKGLKRRPAFVKERENQGLLDHNFF
jgi:hypothetical protein